MPAACEHGEMTEWLKVRAWKVRIPQKGIASSNLAFSARPGGMRNPPERERGGEGSAMGPDEAPGRGCRGKRSPWRGKPPKTVKLNNLIRKG